MDISLSVKERLKFWVAEASLPSYLLYHAYSFFNFQNTVQAQEQRRMMRQEGALQAKLQFDSGGRGKKGNYGNYEATTKRNNAVNIMAFSAKYVNKDLPLAVQRGRSGAFIKGSMIPSSCFSGYSEMLC